MGSNRKPRKAHRPRTPNIPMMAESRDHMATHLHAAVETLINAPDIEAYNNVSTKLITMAKAIGERDCLEAAKGAMISIAERHERVGKVGVSEHEAHVLRQASGQMDAMLGKIPLNKMLNAEIETAIWYETEWNRGQ